MITGDDVTVIIPTIPPRADYLRRAEESVDNQTIQPSMVITVVDNSHKGSSHTRNAGINIANTDWLAFLDDDDEFLANHLDLLIYFANASGADLIYPWFHISDPRGRRDPLKIKGKPAFGHKFDDEAEYEIRHHNNFIPVTVLVRAQLVREVGGFPEPNSEEWPHAQCVDWALWKKLLDKDAKFFHVPERTWVWHWHSGNTSGRADKW